LRSRPVVLDSNLLVRLLTNDDPQQAERVADLIDASARCTCAEFASVIAA
jgi:predicted nucleic acid-binding protein